MCSAVRYIVVLTVLTVAVPPARGGERSYIYYDIFYPACPSEAYTNANDVNDWGVVAGDLMAADCVEPHGLVWFNGVMVDLDDTYPGGVFMNAQSISQTGVVIAEGYPDAVLAWCDGMAVPQPVPPGCEEQTNPQGINDAGAMAVGTCIRDASQGPFVPAVYWIDEGISLDLDLSLPGLDWDATGQAMDVNDDGVVIGTVDGEQRSFIWSNGVMEEVPNGLGGDGVTVKAINNHGLIVGSAETASGEYPAMSYDMKTGMMTELGPGAAKDVNDRGSAVGDATFGGVGSNVLLFENGEIIDLYELIIGDHLISSWGHAINNNGWIVGNGEDHGGFYRGFLLVPVYDKGDYDGDKDVDHQDFQHFQRCFAAEPYIDGTLHVGCSVFDFDDDVDLDLDDYAAFQSAFTGPTAPNLNPNGPG